MIPLLSNTIDRREAGPDRSDCADGGRATPIVHVVDDDDAIRDSLAFMLEIAGFKVRTYASAGAFLGAPPASTRDCVITDIRMPGLSGLEMMAALKARGANLRVIVMTGHGDINLAAQALRIGAADFIEKPFDEEMIVGAVEAVLRAA